MSLDKILHYFPQTDLPLLLSDDHISEIESTVQQLPQSFVEEFLMTWEGGFDDEMTEFIPVGSLPPLENQIFPIVYYKASLLKYEFILATFDKNGNLINRKSIASTIVEGENIKRSIASIETDYIIHIMAGQTKVRNDYEAHMSKSFSMEVLSDGQIIFHEDGLSFSN
jgi:hypothetical protein